LNFQSEGKLNIARRPQRTTPAQSTGNAQPPEDGHPVFAQPQPAADPKQFRVHNASDDPAYKTIDELNREHKLAPLPFPVPRGVPEPVLTLAQVLGPDTATMQ
jgi:hypothetical protein